MMKRQTQALAPTPSDWPLPWRVEPGAYDDGNERWFVYPYGSYRVWGDVESRELAEFIVAAVNAYGERQQP